MIIKGLQKTTLLDFPQKLACTVFTGGCNFRCPFCHNASLVLHAGEVEAIPEEEFFSYISKRKKMLDGVCITGGEPLLCPDIEDFILKIKNEGLLVKLDTNGTFPKKLEALLDKKLVDYVAMDIKNSKEKYALTAGVKEFPSEIEESINIIINKAPDYEFRTTIVKEYHSIDEFTKIGELIKGAKKYFLQCYQYRDSVREKTLNPMTKEELTLCLEKVKPYVEYAALREID